MEDTSYPSWSPSSPPYLLPPQLALMPLTAGRHVAQASSSVLGPQLTSEDATDHETLGNLLQEGTQDHRVCGIPLHLVV